MLQPEDVTQAVLFVVTLPQWAMVGEAHYPHHSPLTSVEELRALGIGIEEQGR